MTSCSYMPLRKQNGLITAPKPHNQEEKKRDRNTERARNGPFPQPLVYKDWLFLVGMKLGSAEEGGIILPLRCFENCTSWGYGQSSQGPPGVSNAPVKLQTI